MKPNNPKTVSGALLLLFSVAPFLLAIVDLPWKTVGLNLALMLGYILLAVGGAVLILDARGELPGQVNQ